MCECRLQCVTRRAGIAINGGAERGRMWDENIRIRNKEWPTVRRLRANVGVAVGHSPSQSHNV